MDRQMLQSTSMHVNEVNGQASGVSRTALGSHTMSLKTSFYSPHYNMHQPAKDNPNLETEEVHSSLRAKKLEASTLDPYAVAKSQGRMDYKLVSEYTGREQMLPEHATSTKSVKVRQSSGQSRSPGSSKIPHTKQMGTAGRQEVEMQLLELEVVAKIALVSASEAAEAAKAAVAMVRKESSGNLENTKKPEENISPSSSISGLDEPNACSIRDFSQFSPSSNNSGSSDLVSNNYTPEDVQKSSGLQQRSLQIKDSAAKRNTITLVSTEGVENPSIKSFHRTDWKEEDVDWKTTHGQEEEGFINKTIQQGKPVQNFSAVPQFDDYSGEEALEEETPFYSSKKASSKQQHGNVFDVVEVPLYKDIEHECSVPQFDDDSCEESSEEETPFYLKGRAARVKENYADGMSRLPSSKLMSASPLTDGMIEGSSSTSLKDIKEKVNLPRDYQNAPLNSFTKIGEPDFTEAHLPEVPASKTIKNYFRSQINAMNDGPGTSRSFLDSSSDKSPSLWRSVTPFSPTGGLSDSEEENPSSQVSQKLQRSSSISENTEFASVSSTASYKSSIPPQDTSLKSPNSSLGLDNECRASKPELELPSPTKYKRMSRRSVRSSRPRQTENNPSPRLDR